MQTPFTYDYTLHFVHSYVLNASRYTGKERDTESGNDYFGARYYASSMDRWMSPDPKMISKQRMFDPQQWNMYSYTRNNPLLYVDPDGKELRIYIWNHTGAVSNGQAATIGAGIAQKYSAAGVKNVSYSVVTGGPFRGMTNDGHSQVLELVNGKESGFLKVPAQAVGNSDPKSIPNYGVVDVRGETRDQAPKTEQEMISNAEENGSHELAHSEMGHSDGIGTDPRIASPDPSDIMSSTNGSNGPFSEKESKILQSTFNRPNEVDHPVSCAAGSQACASPASTPK